MPTTNPSVIVLAGPNGAGKTTAAPSFGETLGVVEFVNADTITQGLAAFDPEAVAFEAGSIMHARLHALAARRRDFAFETTLASRSLAPWLAELIRTGYEFHLVFLLWLPGADFAICNASPTASAWAVTTSPKQRSDAVTNGGLSNFFQLYQRLATSWRMYDNSAMQAVV